ncbi:unnamed protein product [Urochloa humidicola]
MLQLSCPVPTPPSLGGGAGSSCAQASGGQNRAEELEVWAVAAELHAGVVESIGGGSTGSQRSPRVSPMI